jgi:hypothetical protein
MMDSSPDLSVKLRRGSSDSRDSFYMGFAQGIDSDIEEVTTVQNNPPPPPTISPPPPISPEPPQYPEQEEPPIELLSTPQPDEVVRLPESDIVEEKEEEEQEQEEVIEVQTEELVEKQQIGDESEVEAPYPVEPSQFLIEQIPPPPFLPDEDDDEKTNTSVTVIQSKNKPPSSSSSSISSALDELAADEAHKTHSQVSSPKPPRTQSIEAEIVSSTPPSYKSPPSHKSPPRKLNLQKDSRQRNFDSDSIDSINAIDCKIDDDNRDDSSPTDSMPPAPTPPPLGFPLSLEKR